MSGSDDQQRVMTLVKVVGSVARAIIGSIAAVIVLAAVGLNVAPLIAGAGIAGIAVGFGAQSIVKDFFAGFFILLENHYDVGDNVTVNSSTGRVEITGRVEEMTMRVTVLRDLTGALHVVPNGIITMVTNRSAVWLRASVDLAVPASVPIATVRTLLASVLDELNANEHFLALTTAPAWLEGPLDLAGGKTTWRLQCQAHTTDVDAARDRIIAALQQRIPCEPDGTFRWHDAFATPSKEMNEKPAS